MAAEADFVRVAQKSMFEIYSTTPARSIGAAPTSSNGSKIMQGLVVTVHDVKCLQHTEKNYHGQWILSTEIELVISNPEHNAVLEALLDYERTATTAMRSKGVSTTRLVRPRAPEGVFRVLVAKRIVPTRDVYLASSDVVENQVDIVFHVSAVCASVVTKVGHWQSFVDSMQVL